MAQQSQGSFEIEQTLRLARDSVEREIARYRIGVYASVVVVTGLLRLLGVADTWAPTTIFGVACLYGVAVLVFLDRVGNPPALASVVLIADISVSVSVFLIVNQYGTSSSRGNNSTYAAYIIGSAMVLSLVINSLRNSATASLAGGIYSVVLYLAVLPRIAGFHPAQISVALILAIAGVIGTITARQARKNLDSFARLQLLRRYLQPEAVERIMRSDPDSALALGGRLVTVTLLAADLRGFTTMSESLSPTEVMSQLNAYHGAMIDVIERHGGAIDKFIGDGTLVVFGLAGSAEAAAESAVACAGDMIVALGAHNAERARAGAPPLAMGIAVHTGAVIAGNLGVPGRRLEFTVIGDAVNTVSRLEGQTKTSGSPVIVSAETAALLSSHALLRELQPVSLRGKEKAMRVYGLSSAPTLAPPPAADSPVA